jgi:hypothetical protein
LRTQQEIARVTEAQGKRLSAHDIFLWIALAFVPSGLPVAITAYISADVAAVPLLWLVPLALYLITIIVTFQRHPTLSHESMLALQPVALAAAVFTLAAGITQPLLFIVVVNLSAFFWCDGLSWRVGEAASRFPPFD